VNLADLGPKLAIYSEYLLLRSYSLVLDPPKIEERFEKPLKSEVNLIKSSKRLCLANLL